MLNTESSNPLRNPRRNRFRSRSLGAVATTAAAAGLPDSAAATIIYDLTTTYSTGQTINFDGTAFSDLEVVSNINMAGQLNLSLDQPGGMAAVSTVQVSFFNQGGMGDPDYLNNFGAGDTVDGSLSFGLEAFLVEKDVTNPDYTPGTIGYAGFTYDAGSGPIYGWLQIEFLASATDFRVLQWAYDDTGAPINVGAIPEPSTVLLMGLGLAGLAASVRRRWRSDKSTEG